MKTLHVILKNTVENGSHEHIEIDKVRNVSINDAFLIIYCDDIVAGYPTIGKFFLTDVVGYWIENENPA